MQLFYISKNSTLSVNNIQKSDGNIFSGKRNNDGLDHF